MAAEHPWSVQRFQSRAETEPTEMNHNRQKFLSAI